MHTRARRVALIVEMFIDSVPREIYNTLEAARSASSNGNEELADRALKDTTITKR